MKHHRKATTSQGQKDVTQANPTEFREGPQLDSLSLAVSLAFALWIGSVLFSRKSRRWRAIARPIRLVWSLLSWIIRSLSKLFSQPTKYINEQGYVVLTQTNELEHRFIAKQLLGRDLTKSEVVHHINGKRTENEIGNLCLMNREKHEFFHSWLRWKKEKGGGRYPSIHHQKKVLKEEYGGTLLEEIEQVERAKADEHEKSEGQNKLELQERLFEEFRRERKRLAVESGLPAFVDFSDKILWEMAGLMPETESEMLKVNGIGPDKFRTYGASFITIVARFKRDHCVDFPNKRPAS